MTTEELCAEIEELDKLLAEKSYPRLIEELRTLAVEAAKKLREMQAENRNLKRESDYNWRAFVGASRGER